MSVVCDRPLVSPYNNGVAAVRQGKRKEFDSDYNVNGRFYINNHEVEVEETGSESRSGSDQSSIGVESDCASSSVSSSFCAEEGEEVDSKEGIRLGLESFDSLEESLPIKRGLSNFFSGKSKSFAMLASVASSTVSDIAKPENPFNKRRRILLSCNRRASYSSFISSLPPLLSPEHAVEEEDEEQEDKPENTSKLSRSLVSPRSFSLSDLHHV